MNKEEFRDLFVKYYEPLCNFADQILEDSSRAEDAVQDVFVHMWSKTKDIGALDQPKAYLFKSTRHKCIEYLRKSSNDRALRAENERRIQMSASLNIEEEAEKHLLKQKLYNSVRQLPPKCREVFMLSKVNGLTYSEIAEQLGISVKTVENQMGKALRTLRNLMSDNLETKK